MSHRKIVLAMTDAINSAPRNRRTAEIHLQMIKYADQLTSLSAQEFIDLTDLPTTFKTEFSKMRNLTERLKAAGLDVSKI